MNLKELEQAFSNEQYLNSGGDKAKILELTTWWEEDNHKRFEICLLIQDKTQHRHKFSTGSNHFIEALTLWQEPTSPFHQECIDLLKDCNQNTEVLDALNLIKAGIKSDIGNTGKTSHSFEMVTSPFSSPTRLKTLTMLAKELPNKYNRMTDIWTFYTNPVARM